MKKLLCFLSFVACAYSLFSLLILIEPAVIGHDDSIGFGTYLLVPLLALIILPSWLIATRKQAINK